MVMTLLQEMNESREHVYELRSLTGKIEKLGTEHLSYTGKEKWALYWDKMHVQNNSKRS